MASVCKIRGFNVFPKWTSTLCIVLALLFLYNPYLTGPSASGSLDVGHPASHRATVGSSEFLHFTAPDRVSGAVTLEAHVDIVRPATRALRRTLISLQQEPLPSQNLLCASLWFRPPPAA